jgi:hypothetical protein
MSIGAFVFAPTSAKTVLKICLVDGIIVVLHQLLHQLLHRGDTKMSSVFKEKTIDIDLPHYWDKPKVIKAFINAKSTDELMEFFNCTNRMSIMKPIFPDKPAGITYLTYIQSKVYT